MLPFADMDYYYTDTQQRQVRRIIPDLIRARELLLDLVWKDLRARYRYAAIGFLWAILEPLLMALILTFVFTVVFQMKTGEDIGPASMILSGLITWQFLANSISSGTRSLIDNQNLIKKVYFPRETIPIASAGVNLVNLLIGFVILGVIFTIQGGSIGLNIIWIPFLMGIELILIIGLSLFLSCLNAYYRDVGYMVNALLLFGFYASPVFYQLSLVTKELDKISPWLTKLYMLNPMAGLITAYRQVILYNRPPDMSILICPIVFALLSLFIGLFVFRRLAPTISDHL